MYDFVFWSITIIKPNSKMALAIKLLRSLETIAFTTVPLNAENHMSSLLRN